MRTVNAFRCHFWVFLAIVVDLGIAALVAITNKQDIELPYPKNNAIQTLQNYLPQFAALIAGIVVFINRNAISALMTVDAKREIVSRGLTLQQLGFRDIISQGGIPMVFSNMMVLAAAVLVAVAALGPTIVGCLTPTAMDWGSDSQMPFVSFSAKSGVTPPIFCAVGQGNISGYGYGINCPVDSVYGQMYNAFTASLPGTYPVNTTYKGVSYPSSLIGISGSITTLTSRYGDIALGVHNRPILPTDTFDTCIPRMVVSTECSPNLPDGYTVQTSTFSVSGTNSPQNIQALSLCPSGKSCQTRTAPNYGNGVISVFNVETGDGTSTAILLSVGKYAANLTSGTISCTLSAQEQYFPIRITGGLYVSLFPSYPCQNNTSQPNPNFLATVTRMASMALEKMQGQDGKLEAIAYIPQGTDRIKALELGITRLVSVGATEMYSTIDALSGSAATWSNTQNYLFQTKRSRLGVKGKYRLLFILCPAALVSIILVAWVSIVLLRMKEGKLVEFNPLDPGSAIVAGMNRDSARLPVEIVNFSEVDAGTVQKSTGLFLGYSHVKGNRMGIEVLGGGGGGYVQDGLGGGLSERPNSAYKDETPATSPLPTPQFFR